MSSRILTALLQCFDTVGWVIRPVKTVGHITYIVLVQTLNHAQSINQLNAGVLTTGMGNKGHVGISTFSFTLDVSIYGSLLRRFILTCVTCV